MTQTGTRSDRRLEVAGSDGGRSGAVPEASQLSLLAGSLGGGGNVDGPSHIARFFNPAGVAIARDGTRFVSDRGNHTVRMISPDGSVSTLAGRAGRRGFRDGPGLLALFNRPSGLALDHVGGLFVADSGNHTVRRIVVDTADSEFGFVMTVAGMPGRQGRADASKAEAATFHTPLALAYGDGQLFIADTGNHAVRRLRSNRRVDTVAGQPGESGDAESSVAASLARFHLPNGLALDERGNLFVLDSGNSVVRRIAMAGVPGAVAFVTTVAGRNRQPGTVDGRSGDSRLDILGAVNNVPLGIAVDRSERIWFGQPDGRLRRIEASGVVSTITQCGEEAWRDGIAGDARFDYPAGLAFGPSGGTLYVADFFNDVVREFDAPASHVRTVDGQAPCRPGGIDHSDGTEARFEALGGIGIGRSGDALLADHRGVRRLGLEGAVSTAVRMGEDDMGAVAVAESLAGQLYVVNGKGSLLSYRRDGERAFLIAEGKQARDGSADRARFGCLFGIDVDRSDGAAIVADAGARAIRHVSASGEVSRLAGRYGMGGNAEGDALNAALFTNPVDVAVGADGDIYVLDTGPKSISRISRAYGRSTVTTVAKSLDDPRAIALDLKGNLYVIEGTLNVILRIRRDGDRAVVVGRPGLRGFAPGKLPGLLNGAQAFGLKVIGGRLLMSMECGVVQVEPLTA